MLLQALLQIGTDVHQLAGWADKFLDLGVSVGKRLALAAIIFVVGHYVVKLLKRAVRSMLARSKVEPTVQSFLVSLVNILLTIILVVAVIGALGIETSSFVALLASAGVAVGMALSGQLQNVAGGIIVLLFKPYRVGDIIEVQSLSGRVEEIQIFHTVLRQPDNRIVFIPNSTMSSSILVNQTREGKRLITLVLSVAYGTDMEHVRRVLENIAQQSPFVLKDQEIRVVLGDLAESSVDVKLMVWVKTDDVLSANAALREQIYDRFGAEGIEFPFPQTTIHVAKA